MAKAQAIQRQYNTLGQRLRTLQADAQEAETATDAHNATINDWRCCEFLTAEEEKAAAERTKTQLRDYREGVGVGSAGVVGP